jgi:hypothetical protein
LTNQGVSAFGSPLQQSQRFGLTNKEAREVLVLLIPQLEKLHDSDF